MHQPSREYHFGRDQLVINGSSINEPPTAEPWIDPKKDDDSGIHCEFRISRKRQKSHKDGLKNVEFAPYSITAHKKAKSGLIENKDDDYQSFLAAHGDKNEINISKNCFETVKKPSYVKGCVVYESSEALNHLLRDLKLTDTTIEECGVIKDNCKKMITISKTNNYKKDEDYHVDKELGRGGSGVVKLVTDVRSGKKFVSKMMSLSSFDAKEVHVMTHLNHENITQFFGMKVNKTEIQLFQAYAGSSLNNLKGHMWSEDDVIDFSIQALGALHFMHEYGIIHMDIKPDNVCVRLDTKHLYLTDFGSCKTPQHAITGQGLTPEYMSPELCKYILNLLYPKALKNEEVTGKNDVYTWGLTAGFMIEGEHVMLKYMDKTNFERSRKTFPLLIASNPCFMQSVVSEKVNDDLRKVLESCLAGYTHERVSALEGKNQFIGLQEKRDKLKVQPALLENRKMIKGKLFDKLTKKKGPIPETLVGKSQLNYEPMIIGNETGCKKETESHLNCPNFGALFSD